MHDIRQHRQWRRLFPADIRPAAIAAGEYVVGRVPRG
jgi:hypothetical protein